MIQPSAHYLHTSYFCICFIQDTKCRSHSRNCRPKIRYFANFQSLLSCLDAKFLTTKVCENINLAARLFAFLLSATFPFGKHLNLLNSTSFSDTLLTKFDTSNLFLTSYIMFRFSNYAGTISISRLSK